MIWLREEFHWDDGIAHCWKIDTAIGEICADHSPWLNSELPWSVWWYPPNTSDGIRCGEEWFATETEAMTNGEHWLRCIGVSLDNTLVQGRIVVDEE